MQQRGSDADSREIRMAGKGSANKRLAQGSADAGTLENVPEGSQLEWHAMLAVLVYKVGVAGCSLEFDK